MDFDEEDMEEEHLMATMILHRDQGIADDAFDEPSYLWWDSTDRTGIEPDLEVEPRDGDRSNHTARQYSSRALELLALYPRAI